MDEQIAGGPYMNPFERAYERYMVTGVKINPLSGVVIFLGGDLFIVFLHVWRLNYLVVVPRVFEYPFIHFKQSVEMYLCFSKISQYRINVAEYNSCI